MIIRKIVTEAKPLIRIIKKEAEEVATSSMRIVPKAQTPKPKMTIKPKVAQTTFEEGVGANILAEQNKARITIRPKPEQQATPEQVTRAGTNRITCSTAISNPFHELLKDCTPDKARQAETLFFQETERNLRLHCPTTWELTFNQHTGYGGFDNGLENLVKWYKEGKLQDFEKYGIKHVIIGHGEGSLATGNWHFPGSPTRERVMDYISRTIPDGERAIVMCCEHAPKETLRYGRCAGKEVDTSLLYWTNPAKIVESGKNEIIGQFYNPYSRGGGVQLYNNDPVTFTIKPKK